MLRYSISAGRFTLTDFFDGNRYSHDPRTQFMGWAVMYNGAWDYPADTRGYTWGWVHELHPRRWSLRYASAAMPRVANGLRFDRRLFRDRGDVVEGESRFQPHGHDGAVRVLGYQNHAAMGSYAEALRLAARTGAAPDVTATRKVRRAEVRFGRQRRSGIDARHRRLRAAGMERRQDRELRVHGHRSPGHGGRFGDRNRWKRPHDTAATESTVVRTLGRPRPIPGARRTTIF